MKYAAILTVLCLATSAFAAIGYDAGTKTLTYGAASDLSTAVDPSGGQELTDTALMYGNLTKDGFNALAGLKVIGLNCGLTPTGFNLTTSIKATYDASHVLTLNNFGNVDGYNVGGGTSSGRNQYSGTNAYDQMGTQPGGYTGGTPVGPFHTTTIYDNWFSADLSVSALGAGVTALGFVADGRDGQITSAGKIWVTLSDATEASYDYVTFGNNDPTHDPASPIGIGFFYQAPANKFITRIECTLTTNTGSNNFIALDDIGFVIGGGPVPPHAGDANNDGHCDVVDLGILAKNYDTVSGATWARADFNNDGKVDVVDLGILAKNYDWVGAPAGSSAVPEPMTLSLLAVGAAALIRRKK